MRIEFLEGVKSIKKAWRLAPWSEKIIRVDGGYMAFESVSDYHIWLRQR